MDRKEFIATMLETFPEIKDEVLDEDNNGIITLQIGCFKRFTQRAIDENNLEIVQKCFQFIDDTIEKAGGKSKSKVENAIYLSFLAKLNFDNNPNAKKYLSKKLLLAKNDLDQYEQSGSKNNKLNKFLNQL